MRENEEVELKLTCDAAALAALHDWPRLKAASSRATDDLESVYFDTGDRALQKACYVLRVRKTRDGHVQTAKAGGDGLIKRKEWERPVKGSTPSVAALRKTPLADVLGKKPKFEPLFTVLVERTTFLLEQGDSEIEVALDRGRVANANSEDGLVFAPVCEVELELKRGSPADVFALARTIGSLIPVRIGVMSKAERGFDLDRPHVGARKAEPIDLSDEMSVADAFRAISHACLRHMRLNEDILLGGRDPDALHQARVAIRRLRSAFSLFGRLLRDDPRFETIKADLKRISAPLGKARNLDVFLSRTLPDEIARHPGQVELLNLEKQLEVERTAAYDAVDRSLRSDEWLNFCLELVEWINAGAWLDSCDPAERHEPVTGFATRVLDKRRRQVKKLGRNLAGLDPDERHQVRIAAKKLRYGTEFFASLYADKKAKRHREFASALSNIQDALGALNDIATGHELLEGIADSKVDRSVVFAAGLTAAEGDDTASRFLADAKKAHEDLIEARPFWR